MKMIKYQECNNIKLVFENNYIFIIFSTQCRRMAFKALYNFEESILIENSYKKSDEYNLSLLFSNDLIIMDNRFNFDKEDTRLMVFINNTLFIDISVINVEIFEVGEKIDL